MRINGMNVLLLASALVLASCGGASRRQAAGTTETAEAGTEMVDMHNAENALDYHGTYKGTLPAADCPGIVTTLTLSADGRYALHMEYLERDVAFDEQGAFEGEGNLLVLTPDDGGQGGCYKVEENRLRMLDGDRKPITGELADHYVLQKEI